MAERIHADVAMPRFWVVRPAATPRRRLSVAAALFAAALIASLVVAPVVRAAARRPSPWDVRIYQTTNDLRQKLARVPDVSFHTGRIPSGTKVIHVSDGTRYQRVVGVGGAMTDSAAWLFHNELGAAARASVLGNLFGSRGIGLSFVRVPMAASDFTVHGRPYSYDDVARGQTDPQLSHFSVHHDDAYIVPTLRQARAVNPHMEIIANPWSAPPWMKANDAFDNLHSAGSLLASAFQPFANYFVKFIEAYAARGLPIAGVTPENEPRAPANYPSMSFPANQEASFVANDLAPALAAARLSTHIYGAETALGAGYPEALLSGAAQSALSGITQHCYGGNFGALSTIHSTSPAVDLVVSECATELTLFRRSSSARCATGRRRSRCGTSRSIPPEVRCKPRTAAAAAARGSSPSTSERTR
jgi:glucosylceramidase